MTHRLIPTAATLLLLAAAPAQEVQVGAQVGDVKLPSMHNSDGRQSLAQFIGQPVVIDFWGTH